MSQLPRTEGEPLTLTETQTVSRACRTHRVVLARQETSGTRGLFLCFSVCFLKGGELKGGNPVASELASCTLRETVLAGCVKGDRADGTKEHRTEGEVLLFTAGTTKVLFMKTFNIGCEIFRSSLPVYIYLLLK